MDTWTKSERNKFAPSLSFSRTSSSSIFHPDSGPLACLLRAVAMVPRWCNINHHPYYETQAIISRGLPLFLREPEIGFRVNLQVLGESTGCLPMLVYHPGPKGSLVLWCNRVLTDTSKPLGASLLTYSGNWDLGRITHQVHTTNVLRLGFI